MLNAWGPRICHFLFLWSHSSSLSGICFYLFQSLMLLPWQWVHSSLLAFSLALFKFGSLPVWKIPFSVRLGFLILLKSLACEYLSHFCSDSPLCNTGCMKIDSNSCLLFCTGFVFVEPYVEFMTFMEEEPITDLWKLLKVWWVSGISNETRNPNFPMKSLGF